MRRWTLALAVALSLLTLIQANHKVRKGRNALLKWQPAVEALERGEDIYNRGAEGYPTLPLTVLAIRPFLALGPQLGPLTWALFKLALAWWITFTALGLAAGSASHFPPWGALVVLLGSYRVLASDILHGNINILVGATVVLAAVCQFHERRSWAGFWIGLGSVMKVTPALFLLYFLYKRDLRALSGVALGVLVFAFLLPGLFLGFETNLELVAGWWRQMIVPYFSGRELSLLQTEHINQSFLGVFARLTTDSVAIAARPPVFPADVQVNLLTIGEGALRALVLAASALTLAVFLSCTRARAQEQQGPEGRGLECLGEFALGALAMLFLSERSWKHHYVLIGLPLAFLLYMYSKSPRGGRSSRMALAGVCVGLAPIALSGSALLGARGSDLAEAYGAYLIGGLALFACTAWGLRRIPASGEASGVS